MSTENPTFDRFKRKVTERAETGLPVSVSASSATLLCAPGRGLFCLIVRLFIDYLLHRNALPLALKP